ncbi:MAG: hypothetical protein ACU0CA_06030 [Paracoccaceae bacterium]
MNLISISVGLFLAAIGIFFVPVSFSVDGFGLVVNPGGVRTIRASESGLVLHFPSANGQFFPGEIVTAVIYSDARAQNTLLVETLRRELAEIETDHLERTSKIQLDMERDRAKHAATEERLAARVQLARETSLVLLALQEFAAGSVSDIAELNEERRAQLSRLEDLVKRSGQVAAIPAQRMAIVLEDIQADRLSVITSEGTRFSSDRMILDMIKDLNELAYSNTIDAAEVKILSDRISDLTLQLTELQTLRGTMRAEAEARLLAKAVLPQIAVSDGLSLDMRTLQASRADVARGDALRLLSSRKPKAGISLLVYDLPESGGVVLRYGNQQAELTLPADGETIMQGLREIGLDIAQVYQDAETIGSTEVSSVFVEFASQPQKRLTIVSAQARNEQNIPILVTVAISRIKDVTPAVSTEATNKIVGFLENRYAVILRPGQIVRGSINDARTGAEVVFDAHLLERDYSTVDTKELGIRLGNQSLASKIIKRGVLSQVVVGVDADSAQKIEHLPGAVVHLSFPLARQTLFSFLLARNAAI